LPSIAPKKYIYFYIKKHTKTILLAILLTENKPKYKIRTQQLAKALSPLQTKKREAIFSTKSPTYFVA